MEQELGGQVQQRQKDRQQEPRERLWKEPEQQRQKRARTPLA